MNVNVMDIPRIYTGIAEWLACMVVACAILGTLAMGRVPHWLCNAAFW